MLREGMEDFEYLWLLEAKTSEVMSQLKVNPKRFPADAISREICGRLVSSLTNYVTDPATFYQVRRELASEIISLEESPLILLATDPPPSTLLDTGPAVTRLYGFVEKGTSVKVNGSELLVNPDDGFFIRKVRLSWSQPEITIEAELGEARKVLKRRFTIR
jgi:hypothetical protein